MAKTPIHNLLSSALSKQKDSGAGQELGEERVREILSAKKAATREEQQILINSPAARRQLYFMANVIRAEQLTKWQQSGINNVVQLQAAAQSYPDNQPITIDTNPNFIVTLFPPEEIDDNWTIHLKIAPGLLTELKGLRLIDSADREWLAGTIDDDGEISQAWPYAEDPLTVLETQQLTIEPY